MLDYPQYDVVYRSNEDWQMSDQGMAAQPSA